MDYLRWKERSENAHDRERRAVGDLDEEVVDGLIVLAHDERKVARVNDNAEVGAGLLGLLRELDRLSRAVAARSDEEGDVLKASGVECLASGGDDEDAFGGREMARFAVGAHQDLFSAKVGCGLVLVLVRGSDIEVN